MTMSRMAASVLCIGLLLGHAAAGDDDHGDRGNAKAKLYLAISGTAAGGVAFSGTVSVQKFQQVDGQVVAVGMVSGSATSAGAPLGTVLAGPVRFPVRLEPGSAIGGNAPISQQATNCQVLHLELGAVNLNVLGLTVATQPIAIDVSGVTGGTNVLGQLLCTILETVGNVIGLVNLLNQLLGILGGLTG